MKQKHPWSVFWPKSKRERKPKKSMLEKGYLDTFVEEIHRLENRNLKSY